jgi:polyisoprenyl-teichoic acid--peptidoglycan teichoic acid transferase
MINDPGNENDPTIPIPPAGESGSNRQGKLVIGSFQNPPRQPYQYPPQPRSPQQPTFAAGYSQQPPMPPGQQGYIAQTTPAVQGYPLRQPGQFGGPDPRQGQRAPRRRHGCLIGCLAVLLLAIVIGSFAVYTAQRVLAFGSAISTQAPLSTQTGYMGTSDRVNLLVMGYGGGDHPGANLTDSMVVMSLLPQSRHTTLISVPRDLWVQIPPNSGQYQKINAAYEFGSNNGQDPAAGGAAAAQKVSLVTGLDVQYWLTINFTGFRDLINSIGGVDVYVPDSFNACYPKNDDPSINSSWIKVQFNKGMQHMDGETAIRYARAREPLEVCGMGTSENEAELTDFARSARQQIIIKAALAKVKQVSTWPSLFNAMSALQHTIYTNLSLADLTEFALKMDLNTAHRVGLSNQNVLVDSTAPDGEYILAPRNGNWQAIIDYVKQQLYN